MRERKAKRKSAVLFWRLGPYHIARLKAAENYYDINAIEFVESDTIYAWDKVESFNHFKRFTLQKDYQPTWSHFRKARRLMRETMDKVNPDIVALPGWALLDSLIGLEWCLENYKPVVLMSESTAWDEPRRSWKEAIKRRLVKMFGAALVGGTPHADYVKQLGMAADAIFTGYDVVDNFYFAERAEQARLQGDALRNKYKLPDNYFLASARFIKRKNLDGLLKAFAKYVADYHSKCRFHGKRNPWSLVILGDGPQRDELVELTRRLKIEAQVTFPGFVQYGELPVYYGLAQAFIHPSLSEPWGLVVNEAMASGLPVIVSNRCGCAHDLVKDNVNGVQFDPMDLNKLADCMTAIYERPDTRDRMANASREIIMEWSPERFAQGLILAAERARQRRNRRYYISDMLLVNGCILRAALNIM